MIYAILDERDKEKVVLVKANDKEAVKKRINLTESERVVGGFTDKEVEILGTSAFAIVSN